MLDEIEICSRRYEDGSSATLAQSLVRLMKSLVDEDASIHNRISENQIIIVRGNSLNQQAKHQAVSRDLELLLDHIAYKGNKESQAEPILLSNDVNFDEGQSIGPPLQGSINIHVMRF